VDGRLILKVGDNGRGITSDQIRDPRSLGLLAMRELALLCGGRIDIHGIPGKGTTVTLEIPLDTPIPDAADPRGDFTA
jgi:signal transduction histidine kinase